MSLAFGSTDMLLENSQGLLGASQGQFPALVTLWASRFQDVVEKHEIVFDPELEALINRKRQNGVPDNDSERDNA